MAEKEGFEPPEGCPSTVFKTAAFDRSATSPDYCCNGFSSVTHRLPTLNVPFATFLDRRVDRSATSPMLYHRPQRQCVSEELLYPFPREGKTDAILIRVRRGLFVVRRIEPMSKSDAAPDPRSKPLRDIIVIGGSAGAVEALNEIVAGLPADFAASVFVVVHTSPSHTSWLPSILSQ